MNIKGSVLSTDGERAIVRVLKESSCGSCDKCLQNNKCHSDFMLVETPKSYDINANNHIGARQGDIVEIYTENRISLILALITFVLPLALSFVAYYIVDICIDLKIAAVLTLIMFIVFFFVFSRISNKLSAKYSENLICKIIKENGENQP